MVYGVKELSNYSHKLFLKIPEPLHIDVNNAMFPNLHAQFPFSLLYVFRPNNRPSSGDVQC